MSKRARSHCKLVHLHAGTYMLFLLKSHLRKMWPLLWEVTGPAQLLTPLLLLAVIFRLVIPTSRHRKQDKVGGLCTIHKRWYFAVINSFGVNCSGGGQK